MIYLVIYPPSPSPLLPLPSPLPEINYILMVAIVFVCLGFQHSANLTNAYGVAVTTVIFITTMLYSIVIHVVWNFSIFFSIAFVLVFGLIELSFLGATYVKVVDGGWFTLVYGILLALLMLLWKWGTNLRLEYELNNETSLDGIFATEEVEEKERDDAQVVDDDDKTEINTDS